MPSDVQSMTSSCAIQHNGDHFGITSYIGGGSHQREGGLVGEVERDSGESSVRIEPSRVTDLPATASHTNFNSYDITT